MKDGAAFRGAAELGLSRKLSDPPQIGDFAGLALNQFLYWASGGVGPQASTSLHQVVISNLPGATC